MREDRLLLRYFLLAHGFGLRDGVESGGQRLKAFCVNNFIFVSPLPDLLACMQAVHVLFLTAWLAGFVILEIGAGGSKYCVVGKKQGQTVDPANADCHQLCGTATIR